MKDVTDWSVFYTVINRLGPRLLKNVHSAIAEYVKQTAIDSDAFYSDALHGWFEEWDGGKNDSAIRGALEDWTESVKSYMDKVLGPFSAMPSLLVQFGANPAQVDEWRSSVENIELDLNDASLHLFVQSIQLELQHVPGSPEIVVQGIIESYDKTSEGLLIRALAFPWQTVVEKLVKNWELAYQISPEKWEEMVAAAFDRAGFEHVTLTPRSGDYGRDVIAVKDGIGTVRIIDSVKAYKPNHRVRHDDVRSLAGVLYGDPKATKGIVTTTSSFAPGIATDPFISPLIPYRLELMDGKRLQSWLENLAMS